jgi:hypothetical protein
VLPFSQNAFLAVFEIYNKAIWPAQAVAYLAGIAAVLLVFAGKGYAGRLICLLLGSLWLWTGISYHWIYFSRINEMAFLFGSIFVTQGASFIFYGTFRGRMQFVFKRDAAGWIGVAFIVYAMLAYPLIALLAGESWPRMPVFGVTPCPLTIFTFGMMLLSRPLFSRWILAIPLIWSLVGGSAAFLLGVPQDWVLPFSGLFASAFLFTGRMSEIRQG